MGETLFVLVEASLRIRKQKDGSGDLGSSICKDGFYSFLPIVLRGAETRAKSGESQNAINL